PVVLRLDTERHDPRVASGLFGNGLKLLRGFGLTGSGNDGELALHLATDLLVRFREVLYRRSRRGLGAYLLQRYAAALFTGLRLRFPCRLSGAAGLLYQQLQLIARVLDKLVRIGRLVRSGSGRLPGYGAVWPDGVIGADFDTVFPACIYGPLLAIFGADHDRS